MPFYADTAYEYEKVKAKQGEEAALNRIHELWRSDEYSHFFEAQDVYLQTSLKNLSVSKMEFDTEFFRLSSRFMVPLLDALEDRT